MTGTIVLGGKERGLTANGLSPFLFNKVFKKDFFTARVAARNDTGAIVALYTEMAFIMACQHELGREDLFKLTTDDYYAFLESANGADFENNVNIIHAIYEGNEVTTSDPKGAEG